MKTAILNPKTEFLLGAGLDVLHYESQEWLETIALWMDEVRFFENLIKNKAPKMGSDMDYMNMLKYLDKIHLTLFQDLEEKIMDHEKLLSRIEKGEKGLADGDYRDEHLKIKLRMDTMYHDFKVFKRNVFEQVKSL